MKERGFTLIELLAVIVILAIIALIATPMVLNTIDDAKKGAAKSSANSYVKAIETKVTLDLIENITHENKDDYIYDEINVDVKGTSPTGGVYSLKNGIVTAGTFCINGYEINYTTDQTEVKGKCTGEDLKLSGSIKLSQNSGYYEYPTVGTFDVTENISGGQLSCTSSDEEVAMCSIDGTLVTVTPGTKEGTATLTIKSEGSSKYKEVEAAYVVTTLLGKLSVTAQEYTGIYDGMPHGITVTSSESTIKYGLEEGKYTLDSSPTYTDVGTYKVYYQVTREGYTTVTGNKSITINKASGDATLPSTNGKVTVGDTLELTINRATGTLNCSSNDESIASCSIQGTNVIISGISVGTTTIKIDVMESTNYKATSKEYSVVVSNKVLSDVVSLGDYVSMTPTSTGYSILGQSTGYANKNTGEYITQEINPSELNLWRVISINNDGTIDMVSEYASSASVCFRGQTGYLKFVQTLNTIAAQYVNTKYTKTTRNIGYNGQTEYLTGYFTNPAPWTSSTIDNSNEKKGGGDILYKKDTELVNTVLGTLKVYQVGTETAASYWLASRYYYYMEPSYYQWCGVSVYENEIDPYRMMYDYSGRWWTYTVCSNIRPVVTLRSDIAIKTTIGGGISNPWILD